MGSVDEIWHNLFSMSEPYPERIIRSVAIYAFLLVALRFFGKRESYRNSIFGMAKLGPPRHLKSLLQAQSAAIKILGPIQDRLEQRLDE